MKGLLTFFPGGIWWQIPRPGGRAEGVFERAKLFEAVTTSTGCVGRSRPRLVSGDTSDSAQSSDATGRLSRPKAAATAAYVTSPAWVLRPFASAGSARSAPCQPSSASFITYGSVAFVSAHVEVCGTAPGMLATQ